MEHACYKCGRTIEEGTPFCAQCGAPQIRVALAAAAEPASASPDAVAEPVTAQITPEIPAISAPLRPDALRSSAFGAASAVFLICLGLYPLVALISAGVLAVTFYRYRNPLARMRPAIGARLGALSGMLGFGLCTVLGALAVAVLHKGPDIRNLMLQSIQQSASRYPGPEYQATLEFAKSPTGLAVMIVCLLFAALLTSVLLGALGGALAASFLTRREQP